ncbi:MAG: hypothetical protein LUG26_07770 [Ruminococcus sp.]|nr:hypothetical protein [Ruminococcus sp.]
MKRKDNANAECEKSFQKKNGIGVMDIILIIVGASLLLFTISMIQLFREYGAVPDTLVTCVFAALSGECGIMGWIKTTKERNKERNWEKEDKQEAQQEARQEAKQEPTPEADLPRNEM